ncbi:MAG: HAMP domain-containing histidine kinase [FCB group bacterium]|nr:HAMP domain-containing histidine kinase [FCB group bacterium]
MKKSKKNALNNPLRKSLFLRIGLMVTAFTMALLIIIYLVVYFSFSEQDTILDTHECYYYAKMVQSWGIPPDTTKVLEDLENLKMMGCIYENGARIWAFPPDFVADGFEEYSNSEYLGSRYGIEIPLPVRFGDLGNLLATHVIDGPFDYYIAINYVAPDDFVLRFIPASILTSIFMVILFLFLRRYLMPIQLMKRRIRELEKGDLKTKIPIQGDDELADLSKTINRLISDIRELLNNKQQLLSEVSHELRSPLARMQLLIEMIPEHRNKTRMKREIVFLETMIENLLLSGRLSMPYSNLETQPVKLDEFIDKVIALYPDSDIRFRLTSKIPDETVVIDKTKMRIAFRNLLGNALKYGAEDQPIDISCRIRDYQVYLSVRDYGEGIKESDLKKITEPFYRLRSNYKRGKTGFGLGLAITKKIMLAHRGKLDISSEVGKGSTFTLVFPQNLTGAA